MSYVLDALRKSEQERQMAAGEAGSVLHPVMVERRQLTWQWPAAVAAALLVAAALGAWLWSRLHAPAHQAAATAVHSEPVPPAVTPPAPLPTVSVRPAPMQARPAPAAQAPSEPRPRPALNAPAPADNAGSDAKADAGGLPPALLKELPPLIISGFIHDDQAGSMAMIDDKLLHEGDEVAPGLRLEKILADGALFSYKGYRFRR